MKPLRSTKAARCSPWLDNLRHQYEAGVTMQKLALIEGVERYQVYLWLRQAGTKFRVKPYFPRTKGNRE